MLNLCIVFCWEKVKGYLDFSPKQTVHFKWLVPPKKSLYDSMRHSETSALQAHGLKFHHQPMLGFSHGVQCSMSLWLGY